MFWNEEGKSVVLILSFWEKGKFLLNRHFLIIFENLCRKLCLVLLTLVLTRVSLR